MITVFYDGMCGVCRKEINYYKNIAPDNVFAWVDIATDSKDFEAKGYTKSEGLRLLHVEDNTGKMHVGVGAFIVIWRELRYWNYLSHIVGVFGIRHAAEALYSLFARWRFARLNHCQLALQHDRERQA